MPAFIDSGTVSAANDWPSIRIAPAVGATTPPRTFISVDLPAPFSPISADDLACGDLEADPLQRLNGPG